jgi:hypothetical protein
MDKKDELDQIMEDFGLDIEEDADRSPEEAVNSDFEKDNRPETQSERLERLYQEGELTDEEFELRLYQEGELTDEEFERLQTELIEKSSLN